MADENHRPAPRRPSLQAAGVAAAAACLLVLGPGCASSDPPRAEGNYPRRPIKLIVPFGAGGGTDTFARIIKKAIDDHQLLPQPLVIINQGGAGATIGSRRVKDAAPDGYTLLILHDAILTARYSGLVDYGPEAFEPVAGTGEVGMVITVADQSAHQDLRSLMSAVQAEPNTISFGANIGALTHFAGLQLEALCPRALGRGEQAARFRFVQSGGGADRFADLQGRQIDVTGFSIEEFVRFRSEGLRGLAYFGETRHPAAPDVPTATEQGFDIVTNNTFYWWFPKSTAEDRIQVMAGALERAMGTQYVQDKMADIHCQPIFVRGDALRQRIADSRQWISQVAPRQLTPLPNLPVVLAGIVGCLIVVVAYQDWRRKLLLRKIPQTAPCDLPYTPQPRLALLTITATILYIGAMSTGWLGFRTATLFFVGLVGGMLTRWKPAHLAVVLALAISISYGLHALLTRVFVVDLP